MEFVKDDGSYREVETYLDLECGDLGDIYLLKYIRNRKPGVQYTYLGISKDFKMKTEFQDSDINKVLRCELHPLHLGKHEVEGSDRYKLYVLGPTTEWIKFELNKYYTYSRITDINGNKWLATKSDMVGVRRY